MPLVAGLTEMLPPSEKKKGLINKIRRFTLGMATAPRSIAQYRWMTFLDVGAKKRLYTPALQTALVDSDVYAPIRRQLRGAHTDDVLNRQLYTDLQSLSRRRHPGESRPDEHGDLARDPRAIPRR